MKLNNFCLLIIILFSSFKGFSQGPYMIQPQTQTVSGNSGDIIEATVIITKTSASSTPFYFSPSLCSGNSNDIYNMQIQNGGTIINNGEYISCTFYFRRNASTSAHTATYKFKLDQTQSCSTTAATVTVTVNYYPVCNLQAPQTFSTSNITTNSVNLSWSNVPNATQYRIYYRKSTETTNNLYVDSNCCSRTINSLQMGSNYIFTIHPMCSGSMISANNSVVTASTLCNSSINPPANISATPSGTGYIINFTSIPNYNGYYVLDYVNLTNGSTGSQTTFNGDYFYYVSPPNSFNFRIRPQGGCYVPPSGWITITPSSCPSNNYPTNIMAYSQCGSLGLPSVCGGILAWSNPSGTTNNQAEYLIFNTSGQTISGSFYTSSNSFTVSHYTSSSTGPWMIKLRVRSRCTNGSWSDFSPWSANFAW